MLAITLVSFTHTKVYDVGDLINCVRLGCITTGCIQYILKYVYLEMLLRGMCRNMDILEN